MKKGVLRNFAEFIGKHLPESLFWWSCRPEAATLLIKRLLHRCFPVNFAKFPRTTFLQNTAGRLLLNQTSLFFWKISVWVIQLRSWGVLYLWTIGTFYKRYTTNIAEVKHLLAVNYCCELSISGSPGYRSSCSHMFQAWKFIKKKLQHRCFPVNIAKILRTTFFKEHFRWLFLCIYLCSA